VFGGGGWGGGGGGGWGWGGGGLGGEMTQALYAHMNNKRKKRRKKIHYKHICGFHNVSTLYNYYILIKSLKLEKKKDLFTCPGSRKLKSSP
jgi:hypothetical protein